MTGQKHQAVSTRKRQSKSDSDSDSDSASESNSESNSESASDSDSESESIKCVSTNNALMSGIREHRSKDWMLRACAITRHPSMFSDLVRDKRKLEAHVEQWWVWLRKVGPGLPDAIKAEMLLTTLINFGSGSAYRVLSSLGFPTYLNGQFFIRYCWSALFADDAGVAVLRSFIRYLADDSLSRSAYGQRHVYLRLMSRSDDMDVKAIEDHKSLVILPRIHNVEDVNDLLSLGWRPTIGTLLEFAQTHSLRRQIKYLGPAVWSDLSTTLPLWHDSPYDPKLL